MAVAGTDNRPDRSQSQAALGRHARYVGRVGALAVALGIGLALGSAAVASADTDETTSSDTSTDGAKADRADSAGSRGPAATKVGPPRFGAGAKKLRSGKFSDSLAGHSAAAGDESSKPEVGTDGAAASTGSTSKSRATTSRTTRKYAEPDRPRGHRAGSPSRSQWSAPDTDAAKDTTQTDSSASRPTPPAPTAGTTGKKPPASSPISLAPKERNVAVEAPAVSNDSQFSAAALDITTTGSPASSPPHQPKGSATLLIPLQRSTTSSCCSSETAPLLTPMPDC